MSANIAQCKHYPARTFLGSQTLRQCLEAGWHLPAAYRSNLCDTTVLGGGMASLSSLSQQPH